MDVLLKKLMVDVSLQIRAKDLTTIEDHSYRNWSSLISYDVGLEGSLQENPRAALNSLEI